MKLSKKATPSPTLKVKSGLKAGQQYEVRYGIVEQMPDQGGLKGMWTISNAAYFTTNTTTYDMAAGTLKPGTCVEMYYNPALGTIEGMRTGNFHQCDRTSSYYNKNRPILTKHY